MSKTYARSAVFAESKQVSREKIASDIKANIKGKKVIHYLGGTKPITPFEDLFSHNKKTTTFLRYEKQMAKIPHNYQPTNRHGEIINEKTDNDYGYAIRGDFFLHCSDTIKNFSHTKQIFWLDFCGTPTNELMEKLYYFVFEDYMAKKSESVCYVTFYLNSRGCKNTKNIFQEDGKTIEERANLLCNYLNTDSFPNIHCEVFETYINGISPMGVFKFTNTDKNEKKTVEEYVALYNKGFTNKQISIFWRMGIMQVAGYNASAKRKGLI